MAFHASIIRVYFEQPGVEFGKWWSTIWRQKGNKNSLVDAQTGYAHDCFENKSDGPVVAHEGLERDLKTASD